MEKQEQKAEVLDKKSTPSSVVKYLEKVQKALEVWRESGEGRVYIILTAEEAGNKDEKGNVEVLSNLITGGRIGVLSHAVYQYMKIDKGFEYVISKASGRFACEQIEKLFKNKSHHG